MKKRGRPAERFNESQIVAILKQQESDSGLLYCSTLWPDVGLSIFEETQ